MLRIAVQLCQVHCSVKDFQGNVFSESSFKAVISLYGQKCIPMFRTLTLSAFGSQVIVSRLEKGGDHSCVIEYVYVSAKSTFPKVLSAEHRSQRMAVNFR